jgi:hypothetical protein
MVTSNACRLPDFEPIDGALRKLPRDGFDYVWLVDPPAYDPGLVAGMRPVWRNGRSILYRLHP